MSVIAQSADGATHEFPDGTDPAVIDRAMKAYAQQRAVQPSFMQNVLASAPVRALHNLVVDPAEAAVASTEKFLRQSPITGGVPLLMDAATRGRTGTAPVANIAQAPEKPYGEALDAQQNVPGYADERAKEDALTAQRGSGFMDQVTGPVNAPVRGLISLAGGRTDSNAAMDSQQSAQDAYAQRNPRAAFLASILGSLTAVPEGGSIRPPPKMAAPSISDLRGAAKASYRAVDNAGIRVSPDALNAMGDSLQDTFADRLDPTLHPKATAAYNRVAQYATDGPKGSASASFSDLDKMRRVVADATSSPDKADRTMARFIVDHVDDFVSGLRPEDLDTSLQDQLRSELASATSQKGQIARQIKTIEQNKPGALAARGAAGAQTRETYLGLRDQLPQAETARIGAKDAFQGETDLLNAGPQATIDALGDARDLWSRAARAQQIQDTINKAGNGMGGTSVFAPGYESSLRARFKTLADNPRAMSRFSPVEQKAIRDVATGGSMASARNLLKSIGKLSPQSVIPAVTEGSLIFAHPEIAAVGAAGLAGRVGATALTKAVAARAVDLAAMGRNAPMMLNALPVGAPRLTAQSRFPMAAFPLLMGAPQFQQQPR
jgi:hypothetical protein